MASPSTVSVSLGDRSYQILIQAGLLNRLEKRIRELEVRGKAAVVTDHHVARHYLSRVLRALATCQVEAVPIVLPPGERYKTLATVAKVLDVLARHRFERSSFI
ncbi:MAG: hypothetical protein NZM29_06630, partial [Nitrospira sp.]|nr:hypothetical protein [Nitrospira sp.]